MRRRISLTLVFLALLGNILVNSVYSQSLWQIETIEDLDKVPPYVSLALDSLGQPHIVHGDYNQVTERVKYLYRDKESWHSETLESAYLGLSLALDSEGYPHFSSISRDYRNVRYTYYDGTAWHSETVGTRSPMATLPRYTSLALDKKGLPHISYLGDDVLTYAWNNGTSWQAQTVDSAETVGEYSSLALDTANRPHISYYDWRKGNLKYASFDGTDWHIETVDSDGNVGLNTSLALDANDYPHISYFQENPDTALLEQLKYAWYDGIIWHAEVVDSRGMGEYSSLDLDPRGHPHISYCVRRGQLDCDELVYAWNDGSAWQAEKVDNQGGMYSSLALDSVGLPHIGYASSEGLKYAYRTSNGMLPDTGTSEIGPWPLIAALCLIGCGLLLRRTTKC